MPIEKLSDQQSEESPYAAAVTYIEAALANVRLGQSDKSLGGREAALTITKLEEADMWLKRARQVAA